VEDRTAGMGRIDGLVPGAGGRRQGGIGRRVLPRQQDPDGQRIGSGVLDPPLERTHRQGARVEIAADHRAQLFAGQRDPEDLRFEGMPGAREEGVVGTGTDRQAQPQAGRVTGWASTGMPRPGAGSPT
jgi:hypothetical protein